MYGKKTKLPLIIIAIGLLVAAAAHLLTSAYMRPTVTEHDFEYSVTYKIDGETKTLNGVHTSRFRGFSYGGIEPTTRYYEGEYADYGLAEHTYAYTLAQKDGYDICIVTYFNDA